MQFTIFHKILAAFSAIAIVFPVAPAFGFGVGLQPTTVEMPVEPGDRHRQVINIANVHTEKTISLTLGLADWTLDEEGQIQLSPPGESERSGADWVRFSPAFVTLKPGEAEQIIVDMAVPARVDQIGDHRFALLASTILPEARAQGSGVWKKYQIASLFYLTIGNASSDPVISNSGVSLDDTGTPSLALRIENSGNAHARLEGVIEIKPSDAESETVPISNLVVLDGGARNFTAMLPGKFQENTEVKVKLTNIFAPQIDGGKEFMPELDVQRRAIEEVLVRPLADMEDDIEQVPTLQDDVGQSGVVD